MRYDYLSGAVKLGVYVMLGALLPWGAFAATFHVAPGGSDSGPGTAGSPWRTIGKANQTLQPGDTVLIHAGTYDDAIRPALSGTSNAVRIVYQAFGDGDVVLTGFLLTGAPGEGALALGLRNYVTVSGRAPGDPLDARRIRLEPPEDINSLGEVCGSEGVIVENIHAECTPARNCSRGFGFCIGFWDGDYETRYNVLRNSVIIGASSPFPADANDYTEDIVTMAQRAHHNLIENNVLSNCRHSALYADSPTSHSNVIRGNRIHNPEHTALSIHSAGVALPEGARFLVENNVLRASGDTFEPDGFPGNAFQWGSDELLIRHNVISHGGAADRQHSTVGGLIGATSTSFGAPYFATDGRVYNNSIVKNRGPALGMMDFAEMPIDLGRHRFVNNIFYGSDSGITGDLLAIYWDESFPTSDRYIANLWGNPGGDPSFNIASCVGHGGASLATAAAVWRNPADPEMTAWEGFENHYDAAPRFVDYAGNDFRLAAGSPWIDAGAPLTRVSLSDAGSGTTLRVEDARFFFAEAAEMPAWMGIEPEWIAVGTSFATAARVQIATVDDASAALTLASPILRQTGDHVWLWRDSAGREVIHGSAPDIGAYEAQHGLFADGFENGDASSWSASSGI